LDNPLTDCAQAPPRLSLLGRRFGIDRRQTADGRRQTAEQQQDLVKFSFSRSTSAGLMAALFLSLTASTARAQAALVKHIVTADGHPLAPWEKRPPKPKGTILLLHGRTWSSLPDFDLQVPGEHRSLMDALVARGFAVYALDLRGYGATPRDASGWDTPDRSAEDLSAALAWVAKNSGVEGKPALLGWSNGSTVSILCAQRHPDQISALI